MFLKGCWYSQLYACPTWFSGDDVYMSNENERQEYVLNENGIIFVGNARYIEARGWFYGQVNHKEFVWTFILSSTAFILSLFAVYIITAETWVALLVVYSQCAPLSLSLLGWDISERRNCSSKISFNSACETIHFLKNVTYLITVSRPPKHLPHHAWSEPVLPPGPSHGCVPQRRSQICGPSNQFYGKKWTT